MSQIAQLISQSLVWLFCVVSAIWASAIITIVLVQSLGPRVSRSLSRSYEKIIRDFGPNRSAVVVTSVTQITTARTVKVTTSEKDIVETTQDTKIETKTTSIPVG